MLLCVCWWLVAEVGKSIKKCCFFSCKKVHFVLFIASKFRVRKFHHGVLTCCCCFFRCSTIYLFIILCFSLSIFFLFMFCLSFLCSISLISPRSTTVGGIYNFTKWTFRAIEVYSKATLCLVPDLVVVVVFSVYFFVSLCVCVASYRFIRLLFIRQNERMSIKSITGITSLTGKNFNHFSSFHIKRWWE